MNIPDWKITQPILRDTLLRPNQYSKHGLLLAPREFGGVIEFSNNNCRIVDGEMVCDKVYHDHSIEKGSASSVSTPLGRVNFHTHPLHCYISGDVIWGWPSGEDMGQCIRFAQMGNLYHIIFSLEGTYVIVVNKKLTSLTPTDISSIETVFKITHKYRWYKNFEGEQDIVEEFKEFIALSGIKPTGSNALELWVNFANSFKLGHVAKYTNPITTLSPDLKAFKVFLFKNKSIQYSARPEDAFKVLKTIKTSDDLSSAIKTPKVIQLKL